MRYLIFITGVIFFLAAVSGWVFFNERVHDQGFWLFVMGGIGLVMINHASTLDNNSKDET